jgi:Carboxypeptidase regulatory-like domain
MNYKSTRWFPWIVGLLSVLLSAPSAAFAQGRAGVITGKVTDPSGAVLQGAQVSLEPLALAATSNEHGVFFINGLAPGRYTLTIKYAGFETLTTVVTVDGAETNGEATVVDATLHIPSENQTVLVTAPRATGGAEAITIGRTAPNIVQVLPAEVIRSLPNANMADALGRLPSITLERDEGEGK